MLYQLLVLVLAWYMLGFSKSEAHSDSSLREIGMPSDSSTQFRTENRTRIRLVTYNVLYGGEGHGVNRLERLQKWIRFGSQDADTDTCPVANRYDYAAFNECNGWQQDLQRIADGFGFPHVEILVARTGFHIAFMSRYPFHAIKHSGPPFHHGKLCSFSLAPSIVYRESCAGLLEIRDERHSLAFLLTHLSPHSAAQRALEAGAISRRAAELDAEGVPALVLGDLNTLSRLDAPAHARSGLAAALAASPALARKFLTADGAIDYRPMDVLLDALIDLAAIPLPVGPLAVTAAATETAAAAEPGATVPTACGGDPMHAAAMRLDYVLATPRAAALAAGPARAVDDGETGGLSDHLPVECALDVPAAAVASP
jgi:endonuclease/exonuclease/phosphatase family metal-dependent hydrolase